MSVMFAINWLILAAIAEVAVFPLDEDGGFAFVLGLCVVTLCVIPFLVL